MCVCVFVYVVCVCVCVCVCAHECVYFVYVHVCVCVYEQVFNRDADQLDALTSGHDAFLDFGDTGVCFSLLFFSCVWKKYVYHGNDHNLSSHLVQRLMVAFFLLLTSVVLHLLILVTFTQFEGYGNILEN